MSSMITEHEVEPWRRRLYLPAFRLGDAARYAKTSTRTVSYWHRGRLGDRPTLSERSPRQDLSYYQLVEVAFVATFRDLGVPLQRIRRAREYAAQVLQAEYPFAQYKWFTEGHLVLLNLRDIDGEAPIGHLVAADAHGQIGWKEVVSDRFDQFDYEHDLALVWHLAGRESPVSIDPRVSFGAPTVGGVPTWVLKGRWDVGESVGDIQDDFGLREEEIRRALEFEGVVMAG